MQGTVNGSQGQGTLSDPQTGGSMPFTLNKQGSTVNIIINAQGQQLQFSFSEGGGNNGGFGATTSPTPNKRNPNFQYDQNLIGNWINSQSYTSGSFSAATQTRLIIQADGTYLYGDGKFAGGTGGVSWYCQEEGG